MDKNKPIRSTETTATHWQAQLANTIDDPVELFRLLNLEMSQFPDSLAAIQLFKLRVSRHYLSKIKPGDINDPLLLQVLPKQAELKAAAGYTIDPLNEQQANKIPGELHKYKGRVLITTTSACSINCRYCFRCHFPYNDNQLNKTHLRQIVDYLARDTSINEVILSGGDPLIATDYYLDRIVSKIRDIPYITHLRIHTRLPITIPDRITENLITILQKIKQCIVVTHCNHPNELDDKTHYAMQKLKQANIHLFNQTVLLKNINNDAQILATLSRKLFDMSVIPYYLHLLGKVAGAAHFDTPLAVAKQIYSQLQCLLPGYLVPKLVREDPEHLHKVIIA